MLPGHFAAHSDARVTITDEVNMRAGVVTCAQGKNSGHGVLVVVDRKAAIRDLHDSAVSIAALC
jgi:hypothetical protein